VPAGGGTANAAQAPVASRRADSPQAQNPEVQKIAPPSPPSPPATSAAGFVEPPQLKILLHKIWLAEYRINDLLTQVRPERWKILEVGRNSFNQTLENLRKGLAAQEDWRAQFEKRPESMYLGYETYIAIGAVLPRLEAVAHSVSQYENPSFGVQYSQAGNQLFDLQQALQPFLEFLLRAQDQLLLGSQSNLASCQNELGFAMHARAESAKPMKNILPLFKGRRATHRAAGAVSAKPATGSAKQAVRKTESKTEAKPASKSKPAQKK
jgi:hypothetical protein